MVLVLGKEEQWLVSLFLLLSDAIYIITTTGVNLL